MVPMHQASPEIAPSRALPDPLPPATTGLAQRLAHLAQATDAQAWDEVIRTISPWVHQVCERLLQDRSLADDAIQETLLAVRAHAGAFRVRRVPAAGDPDAQALRWIVRFTANCARMVRRGEHRAQRRGRDVRAASSASLVAPSDPQDQPERRLVLTAVDALPERERAALLLRVVSELPYEAVAQELSCPIGSAKTWVHRALTRLRRQLRHPGLGEAGVLALLQVPVPVPTLPLPGATGAAGTALAPSPAVGAPSTTLLPTTLAGASMASVPFLATACTLLVFGGGLVYHQLAAAAAPASPPSPPPATTPAKGDAADLPPPNPRQRTTASDIADALESEMHVELTHATLGDAARFLSFVTRVTFRADDDVAQRPVRLTADHLALAEVLDLCTAFTDTVVAGTNPVRLRAPDPAALARQLDAPCSLVVRHAQWRETLVALWIAGVPVIDCAPPEAGSWEVTIPDDPSRTLRSVLTAIAASHGQHWRSWQGRILLGDGLVGRTDPARLAQLKLALGKATAVHFEGAPPDGVAASLSRLSSIPILVAPTLPALGITMQEPSAELEQVLDMIASLASATVVIRSGAVIIAPFDSSLLPMSPPPCRTPLVPVAPSPSGALEKGRS